MKINRLDAHDRLLHFKSQGDNISKGCQDCINSRPDEFGRHPFYIFAHKREIALDERVAILSQDQMDTILDVTLKRRYRSLEDVPTHRMLWQPRLGKPSAQPNSMLFRTYPGTDTIKIIWMLPDGSLELWDQYKKGLMTENSIVTESMHMFQFNKTRLEAPEDDDVSQEEAERIYKAIARNPKYRKNPLELIL